MCGRISLYSDPDYLARIFDAQLGPDVDPHAGPSWNVPPTSSILAVADVGDAADPGPAGPGGHVAVHRQLGRYRWGLVPSWAKDPAVGNRMFNARAETLASKPSYSSAFTARRLIVVADGFYEWKQGTGRAKHPYYFTRADGRPLALAGLWEQWWDGPDGRRRGSAERLPLRTCTIITTEAGPDMKDIHHRMPVVLEDDTLDEWLDPANRIMPELGTLLVPSVAGTLDHRPVAAAVGNVRNDSPELTEAVAD
jgi:putative SOS response-associated peptidase YedK